MTHVTFQDNRFRKSFGLTVSMYFKLALATKLRLTSPLISDQLRGLDHGQSDTFRLSGWASPDEGCFDAKKEGEKEQGGETERKTKVRAIPVSLREQIF